MTLAARPKSSPPEGHSPTEHLRALEGDQTREALLDAAEALFAVSGPDGVSIRSVNAAAGLAPAAVHYHFGRKDALVIAVIRRRGDRVTRRHFEELDLLDRNPKPTTRGLVKALVDPLVETLHDDPAGGLRWMQLAAWLAQQRDPRLLRQTMRPNGVNSRFEAAVYRVFPDQPRDEVRMRWRIAAGAVLRLLANADSPMAHDPESDEVGISAEYIRTLTEFTIAGLDGARRPARNRAR
jgi:AcrR family transcriptional regulator